MGLYTHIYFLPFYFQAVKSTTAEGSGIRTIPYLVSITLASIAIGGSITTFGWYTPFLWFGSAVFTIGAGMLYTLQVDSGPAMWIGYQILTGIGAGASVQIPFISVQVVLSAKDMPTGSESFRLPPSSDLPILTVYFRRPDNLLQLPRRRHRDLCCSEHLLQYSRVPDNKVSSDSEPRHHHRCGRHSCR